VRTFDFDWDSVNQPVDSALFTYATFQISDNVGILDDSTGQPVWLKALPGQDAGPAREQPTPRSGWGVVVATGILVLVLLALVVARLAKRAKSRPA